MREQGPIEGREDTASGSMPPGRRKLPVWLPHLTLSVAVILVLAVAAITTVAVLFAKGNPGLSRRIVALIDDAVGSDSTRFECDGIHGSLFGGAVFERPRLRVLTVDGPITWISAERITADYDLVELILSRRRSLRVSINSPFVPLVHDSRGNLVVPRFGSKRARAPSGAATRISVQVEDGTFSLDRGGVRFGSIRGSGIVMLEPGKTALRLERVSGLSRMPGRPGTVRASGIATVSGRRVRIDPLYVALDRSRVRSAIDWDLEKASVVSSRTGFAPLDLAETMRILDLVPVTEGTLLGEVSFSGDPASGAASVKFSGTIAGEPIDTLLARATFVPGAVHVDEARARVRQAEVSGKAVFETRGVMTAEARLRDVDPALIPWWKLPRNIPHGLLSGRASIRARKARPFPVSEVALDLDKGRLGRLPVDRGSLRLRLGERGDVAVDTAWIDTPGATLFASGTIAADTTLSLAVGAGIRDLGSIDSIVSPILAETGSGWVAGTVSGNAARPDFQARATLVSVRLKNGLGFDSLTVRARGALGSPPAADVDLSIAGLHAGRRPLGTVASTLRISDRIVIERYRQALGDTTVALRGALRFHGKEVAAALDSVVIGVGSSRWRNAQSVDASFEDGRLRISRMVFDLDPGRLDLAGVVWPREGRIDARGTLRGVDLSRALGRGEAGGIADGDFLMTGPLDDPEIQTTLSVLNPRAGSFDGDSLTLDLTYAPGLLTVAEARWARGPGRISLQGTARPRLMFRDWIRSVTRGDRAWTSRVDLALAGGVDSLDLGTLAAVDTSLGTLEGFATVRTRVTGTAAAPVLSLVGRGSSLKFHGVAADEGRFEGTYAGRRLVLSRLDLSKGDASSHVEGSIPIDLSLYADRRWLKDEPVALKIRTTDADFGIATLFVPDLASSGGKLTVSADVAGTLAKPDVTGTLKLHDGILRVAGRDEVLEGLEMDASFDERRVNVAKVEAREGKRGRLSGAGWWRWEEGRRWGDYEFRLRVSEFTATDRETYVIRFNGDFLVQDAINPDGKEVQRVTSVTPAFIVRGELTLDFTQQQGEREPIPFQYDIVVDVPRNLWYRNLDTEMELGGRLTLRNDGVRDLILGSLDVKGKYYLYANEFQIRRGTISFTTLDRIDPDISIEAVTKVQGPNGEKEIYQTLTGRSSHLNVHLHDVPSGAQQASSESYLWKVLTIGQITTFGSEDRTGEEAQTATPDVTLPVKNYLFRNAERWLADVGFIDTIDLKSGTAAGTAPGAVATAIGLVGVGKYVTPGLYLRYSRDFSGTAAQKLSAEYRVTRYLLLRGEQIQQPTKDQAGPQYNLDLKVRLEY
ncbi:MAG: translocation/assembly module TamB domain-containing protein [Candidatus Latescibacteria bacterium]|nr:translocation/assembly module TamB domain-containing protein [Candidatus Latescibacterota bacterium]